jgi:hypothetical protein
MAHVNFNKIIMTVILASISSLTAMEETQNKVNKQDQIYSTLKLLPDQKPQKVVLPYPYKHVSSEEREKTVWVPEGFYTTLDAKSKHEFIVVGFLRPCIAVVLKNDANGKIVVFHKQFSNSVDDLIECAKNELEMIDPSQVHGVLFTNKSHFYHEKNKQTISGIVKSWCDLHNNKTQSEELQFIKESLLKGLNIVDHKSICEHIFSMNDGCENPLLCSDYPWADQSLIIGKNFTIESICMLHENIFGDFEDYHRDLRQEMANNAMIEKTIRLRDAYSPEWTEYASLMKAEEYNSISFIKLD